MCCRVLLPPLVCSMRPSPACAHEHVLRWRVARCTGGWGWAAVAASSRRLLVVASVLASFSFYSVWCRVVSVRCVRGWPVVRMCGREGSGWLGGVKVRFWTAIEHSGAISPRALAGSCASAVCTFVVSNLQRRRACSSSARIKYFCKLW